MKQQQKIKALILAAGHGSRLRPLSQSCPKPFVPFLGVSPAHRLLSIFHRLECIHSIAINSFHASEVIDQFQGSSPIPFYHSKEKVLLNTGGGIANLKDWLDGDDLLVASGDILADFDFQSLIERFSSSDSLATIGLIPHVQGTPPCEVVDQKLKSIRERGSHTFAGCYVLSNRFIESLEKEPISIIEPLQQRLSGLKINVFEHTGYWQDLGTPERFCEAQLKILADSRLFKNLEFDLVFKSFDLQPIFERQSFFSHQKVFDQLVQSNIKKSIFNGSCVFKNDLPTHIQGCVIMPGSTLQNTGYSNQIIGPDYTLSL